MQPVNLSIPKPCHENWDRMQPEEKGRFCNACAKQVVDFSTMSDAAVLRFLTTNRNDNVCGRVYPEQLNRTIEMPVHVKKKNWFWNYAAMFLLFFSKSSDAKAQRNIVQHHQPSKPPAVNNNEPMILGEIAIAEPTHAISGKITDANGNPVPFATIHVSNKKYTADNKGSFVFIVNDSEQKIAVAANGFVNKTILLTTNTNYLIRLERKMQPRPEIMGKIMVQPVSPKKS